MSSSPDYSQAEDWASCLMYAGSCKKESLQELSDHAVEKFEISGEIKWVLPIGLCLWNALK